MDFFEILVHRDARARRPRSWCSCAWWRARACARARPRESSPTMHRVLVHRGARPRESSPTMDGVLLHRGARPRPSVSQVCVSHVSGVCQPAPIQEPAARGQSETQNRSNIVLSKMFPNSAA